MGPSDPRWAWVKRWFRKMQEPVVEVEIGWKGGAPLEPVEEPKPRPRFRIVKDADHLFRVEEDIGRWHTIRFNLLTQEAAEQWLHRYRAGPEIVKEFV